MRSRWQWYQSIIWFGSIALLLLGFQNCSDAFRESPLMESSDSSVQGSHWHDSSLILSSPLSHDTFVGSPLTLMAEAKSAGSTFQWRRNGVAIVGATSKTLSIPSATTAYSGVYTVLVSVNGASEESSISRVNVYQTPVAAQAPIVTMNPANVTDVAGASVVLQVGYSAYPEPTFQWFKDSQPLAGKTSPVLRLDNISTATIGNYALRITNSAGYADSRSASVTLLTTY